ncbi:hypothetical protein [Asticcacaulis taihuensis]|uniref:hypothetical protein n=1 Tax=Asticcacaulis taihuensis TaxID=260084 RepID=UPI003F7B9B71
MPKWPNGQHRPADAIGCAIMVGKIATGEMLDDPKKADRSMSARSGGTARASPLTAEKRSEIAINATLARWQPKEASMQNLECAKLAATYEAKKAAGLVDVKFFLRNTDEVLGEEICAEVNRLDEAIANGDFVPLVFDDRHKAG